MKSELAKQVMTAYENGMRERYDELIQEDGSHLWGLDREVMDGVLAYIEKHSTAYDLLVRSEKYGNEPNERVRELARLDHDNLAINGELCERCEARQKYSKPSKELEKEALFSTDNYIVLGLGF